MQDLKERVRRDNAKYVDSWRGEVAALQRRNRMEQRRSILEMALYSLAVVAIISAFLLLLSAAFELRDEPEAQTRQVISDSIGAARYYEAGASK